MRYELRSLLAWLTIAPLLIAIAYWSAEFARGGRLQVQVYLAFVALSVYCCVAAWRGINQMLFGPTALESWRCYWRRKRGRRIRVRIEKYVTEST